MHSMLLLVPNVYIPTKSVYLSQNIKDHRVVGTLRIIFTVLETWIVRSHQVMKARAALTIQDTVSGSHFTAELSGDMNSARECILHHLIGAGQSVIEDSASGPCDDASRFPSTTGAVGMRHL